MQVSRNKSKYTGLRRVLYSAKYSIDGLMYAYGHEHSLWLHGGLSLIAIAAGFLFNISHTQWGIVLITLAVILAFELVNTAMEACVDMVTLEYHELARIAKDCCSAATFVMSICGIIIMCIIFGPKILALLGL